ncbi:hypothetical protein J2125_002198 [Erwinia toletana]|uniref:Uncharacterized protein n=1 Tax=Winslowiella toletana TaxID=92490 RepID=A0ABS4P8P2_9GAMM|nr:hypothetical protein [Winslowiella toletana]MBP2169006.1 hypothetical protein [Winslowiella toletana]
MIENSKIITKMQANKELAVRLEHALKGVKDQVLAQARLLGDAFTRLTWYTSCFTENYQDVCTRLSHEDIRFGKGIAELLKPDDIVYRMIEIYIQVFFQGQTDEQIKKIASFISGFGATISSNAITSRMLVHSLATTIRGSFSIQTSIDRKIGRLSNAAVLMLSGYGLITKAAESANNLKEFNRLYYSALYSQNLEMMYFLIEPVIQQNYHFQPFMKSEREMAEALMRLMD